MGERNIFLANSNGAIDATRQAIKDRFYKEDLKQLININKCLICVTNKEIARAQTEHLSMRAQVENGEAPSPL